MDADADADALGAVGGAEEEAAASGAGAVASGLAGGLRVSGNGIWDTRHDGHSFLRGSIYIFDVKAREN